MANYIGSLVNVGIGIEATRGTAVAPAIHTPVRSFSVLDKAEVVEQQAPYNTISTTMQSDVAKRWSNGAIETPIQDNAMGYFLTALMGASPTTTTVETGVRQHVFNIANNNTHKSLSIHKIEGNDNRVYPGCMIENAEFNYVLGEYSYVNFGFLGKSGATASSSATYTEEKFFRPQDVTFKMASNYAGLTGASAIQVEDLKLTIDKGLVDYQALGSIELAEIFNQKIMVTGTATLLYDNNTYRDLYTLGTDRAVRIELENTKTLIGATKYPKLQFDIYKANVKSWEVEYSNEEIVKQTIEFEGRYSLTDTKEITATLINTVTSY